MENCKNELNKTECNGNKTDELFKLFKDHNIDFHNIKHPEVFTVEAMLPHLNTLKKNAAVTKNLFLKDKKGKLYLLAALHDKSVNLGQLCKSLKASGSLRFASEEVLNEVLCVKQGSVTAFALMNDSENRVQFWADEDLFVNFSKIYFHPLVNNASTGISCEDFKRFVQITGHELNVVKMYTYFFGSAVFIIFW